MIQEIMKILFVVTVLSVSNCEIAGPNVCTKNESYIADVVVSQLKPYKFRNTTKFRLVLNTERVTKMRVLMNCCNGFRVNFNKTHCIPNHSKDCVHGELITPGICQCYEGYGGSTCNFSCSLCKNHAVCDTLNGQCRCSKGWRGLYCELSCTSDTYGENCSEICKCNHGTCHHVSGNCSCDSGWTGKFCNNTDKKLNAKQKTCFCLNGGSCTPDGKTCTCTSGWFGNKCEQKCNSGHWGQNCIKKCSCFNGATCNHTTGICICPLGFIGNECFNICPQGTYGRNCAFNCTCNDQGSCSNVDGTCACFKGWSGGACNISLSMEMKDYLPCVCKNTNFICDRDQKCVCRDGYDGPNCDVSVNKNKWFIYGSISLGIFLTCATFINCIFAIAYFVKKSYNSVNQNTLDNRLYADYEEMRFIQKNNVVKMKNINLHQDMLRNRLEHVYEEIVENPYRYDKLNFGGL